MFRITGGLLVDGSGDVPRRNPGLVVRKDKIYFSGEKNVTGSAIEIDVTGLIIAPGFIDAHSHSDVKVLKNPKAQNRIMQGITTEVTGNCGYTPFPVSSNNEGEVREDLESNGLKLEWKNFGKYADAVNSRKPAINTAALVGQGTLRSAILGNAARKPTKNEIEEMKELLRKNLEQGAYGLSSGLEYTPSGFADVNELAEVCKVVSEMGRVYATHMRNEGSFLQESIEESLNVSKKSGARLEVSHLKAEGRANWGKGIEQLERLEKVVKKGKPVGWDAYPYDAASTNLTITIPKEMMDGGFYRMLERINIPDERKNAKEKMAKNRNPEDWHEIVLEDLENPELNKYNHRNILDISKDMKESCEETVLRLLEKNHKDIMIIAHTMNNLDVDTIVSHPLTAICSDSSVYVEGTVHPRSFGTFPRVFKKYVRDLNFISVQEMVRKSSSLTADRFGIDLRGYIKDGYFADLVIFNPNTFGDKNTFESPTVPPEGVEYLFVNGVLEIERGKITADRGGRALKKV